MSENTPERSSTRELTVERTTSTGHRLLHHDGVCANLHGHNMAWTVVATVKMAEAAGDSNMPVDLKDISDRIDRFDHALILNVDDPLVDTLPDSQDIIAIVGDPTCEAVAGSLAKRLVTELAAVMHAEVTLQETEKYGITAEYPSDRSEVSLDS